MSLKFYLKSKIRQILGINEIDAKLNILLGKDLSQAVKIRAAVKSADFIEDFMTAAKCLDSDFAVLDEALRRVPADSKGMYCEFGVFKGRTINYIARKIKRKIYGFDSFEGLPDVWRDGFPKGAFRLSDSELPKCEKNIELIPGWFEESLPIFLNSHPDSVAFLHVDCDLYSSTKTIFENIGSRLEPGAIIVFDEYFNYPGWKNHEHLAFMEFIQKTGRSFEYVCYNRHHEQVAVQLL